MNSNSNKILKSTAIFFLLAVLFFKVNAQQFTFSKIYEDNTWGMSTPLEFLITPDKGYLVGNSHILLKTDSLGNKQFLWDISASFYSMCATYDGGYVGVGTTNIVKLDSSFNIVWAKNLSFPLGINYNTAVKETPDHGFIIGGILQPTIDYGGTVLIKTDSLGVVQWSKFYRTTLNGFSTLIVTPDHGYLLGGIAMSAINGPNPTFRDICLIKVDSVGNVQWGNHYTMLGVPFDVKHITSTADGNFVIGGSALGQCLLKIDGSGNVLWMKNYASPPYSFASWVEETTDHGFIMSGRLGGSIAETTLIIKTDSAGNLLWTSSVGGYSNLFAGCIKQTSDSGYLFSAYGSNILGNGLFVLFKTDSVGMTGGCRDTVFPVTVTNLTDTVIHFNVFDSIMNTTTSPVTLTIFNHGTVNEVCPTGIYMPERFIDLTLSPNPATTHITLQYHLTQNATLQIHDITGCRVLQTTLAKTSTTATIDVSALPTGMYFYSVQGANGGVRAGKFVKE